MSRQRSIVRESFHVRPRALAFLAVLFAGLLLLPVPAAEAPFFTVANRDGAWWLIDPQGCQTLSIGVNKVSQGDTPADWSPDNPSYSARRVYDTDKAWQDRTLARLTSWGFNTVGSYSDPVLRDEADMPFTIALALGKTIGAPWVDLWSPDVERAAAELARKLTAPWRDNTRMIGYFVDNENPWWDETLFAYHLGTPWRTRSDAGPDAPWVVNQTKLRLFEILNRYYGGSLERLSGDWEFAGFLEGVETSTGVARVSSELESFDDLREPVTLLRRLGTRPAVIDLFMAEVYERYGQLMSDAVKAADPNHLILGERYQQFYNPAQVRAASRWFDVISINYGARVQDGWVSPNHLAMLERLSGRPVLIGEYYFAASENSSGSRNSGTAYPVVKTQLERAAGYATQVRQMASLPSVIGWHWFQYFDQPPEGDTDGEDFNMGLVDIFDREYPLMTEASTMVNSEAYALHERALPLLGSSPARPSVFAVPRAETAPVADGDLRDWNKLVSWLPELSGQPYDVPIGDVFLSTTPGALHVAAQYQSLFRDEYTVKSLAPGEEWPEAEGERLTVALAWPDGSPLRTITWALFPEDEGWRLMSDTGGEPLDWPKEFGEWNHTAAIAFEGTIPVPPVADLRLAVELRSRADGQLLYWGEYPLHENPSQSGWGRLTLPVDADPPSR